MLNDPALCDLVERDIHDLNRLAGGSYSHEFSQVCSAQRCARCHPFSLNGLLRDDGRGIVPRCEEQGNDLPGLPIAGMVIEQRQVPLIDGLVRLPGDGFAFFREHVSFSFLVLLSVTRTSLTSTAYHRC